MYYSSCLPVPPPSGARGSSDWENGMNCYFNIVVAYQFHQLVLNEEDLVKESR